MGIISTEHRGHNAIVPGAAGQGLKEHEVAQQITNKHKAVTKGVDCTDNVGRTANDNLVNIVNRMNKIGKGVHISHHLNAFNGSANGFEVWYYAGDATGKKYAEAICKAVCAVTGWTNRGAKATTALYVIRASVGTSILIEWGFIDSKKDMDILKKSGMMDKVVNASLKALGYSDSSGGSRSSEPSTGSGLAKNTKPVTNGKVGDTVKVYDALYADSYGAGRSINSRGRKGKIKDINPKGGKKYLIENWGWAHPNDLQLVTDNTYQARKVGDTVTVQNFATHYQTGQKISSFVKGSKYKIKQTKNVNQSKSKRAYLLDGINSWVLEQDVK